MATDNTSYTENIIKQGLAFGSELIFETNADFQISKKYGDAEIVFQNPITSFSVGTNFLSRILEVLNSPQLITSEKKTIDGVKDIEQYILKFLYNKLYGIVNEHIFQIAFEKDNNTNLMDWKIVKSELVLIHYIKTTPIDAVAKIGKILKPEIVIAKVATESTKNSTNILNLLDDGIVITDSAEIIKFINYNAKTIFFSADTNFATKANFENKTLSELIAQDNEALAIISKSIENVALSSQMDPVEVSIRGKKYSVKIHSLNETYGYMNNEVLLQIYASNNEQALLFQNKYYATQHKQLLEIIKKLNDEKHVFDKKNNELLVNQRHLIRQNSSYLKQLRLFQLYLDNVPIPIVVNNLPEYDIEYANIAFCAIAKIDKKNTKGISDEDIFSTNDIIYLKKIINQHIEQDKQGFLIIETEQMQIKQLVLRDASLKPIKLFRIFHKFPIKQ